MRVGCNKRKKYYIDEYFTYSNVYRNKAIQTKSKFTNIVENLNSKMRDKISYLVRRIKVYSKSFDCLNNKLALFFINLNLKGNK